MVPYLDALGVSHCYLSPYLKARPGSVHGYDIVDHQDLHPDLGDWTDFEAFLETLQAHGMGQIADAVVNHMGVGGADNAWWLDVLENGQASRYAQFFDVDWDPMREALKGKILIPLLGARYGTVLERGELQLVHAPESGELRVEYYEHRFPIDPRTYPQVLRHGLERLEHELGPDHPARLELESLLTALERLPSTRDERPEAIEERARDGPLHKQRLAALCAQTPEIAAHVQAAVAAFGGDPERPSSFDALHGLLEAQPYRLSHWRVAADEINYRRFFDINDLAGLRQENPAVFEATHKLLLELYTAGKLHGLRIDHPDGLYDPGGYLAALHEALLERAPAGAEPSSGEQPPCYLAIEKILAPFERLRPDWPVAGSTGYEFLNGLNGLLLRPDGERALTRTYGRFTGVDEPYEETLYRCKRLVIRSQLSGELTVLANLLDRIAQSDRRTRDYTLNGLREALTEVVACFPVYRTYVTPSGASDEDRQYIRWAVRQAKKRSPAADVSIFDFVHDTLRLEGDAAARAARRALIRFVMRFQQYTAPVTAKALEDTSFYVYNRLVSLNEVGGDPRRFGISVDAFHRQNRERARDWPRAMLATSTHDTKRSEDVRARLDVLSEIPDEWRRQVHRWARTNRRHVTEVDEARAPDRNDEYLFYQTVLGAWPLGDIDEAGLAAFRERVESYMLKAVKEAKVHTSWINPNTDYEEAVSGFVRGALERVQRNPFLDSFLPFARRVAYLGLYNSLSQTLLKLTAPGVPDIYQGCELWDFSLVDPDNRRPVDYAGRAAMLRDLEAVVQAGERRPALVRGLLDSLEDGRAKLYVTWTALEARRRLPALFGEGDYAGLEVRGPRAEHLCAFARRAGDAGLVTVAPRWFASLCPEPGAPPLGEAAWAETVVEMPHPGAYRNALTGVRLTTRALDGRHGLPAADMLGGFPVALLEHEP
ncbi:MAG: malto-oligosyltrehalose synthase [Gammaproteobacteria bacterium]|nr:malto-oligosyltrehalose synthase [Gammaproteobacteria bacterium]